MKEKKFYPKKSLMPLLHQAIQLFDLLTIGITDNEFPNSRGTTCLWFPVYLNIYIISPSFWEFSDNMTFLFESNYLTL